MRRPTLSQSNSSCNLESVSLFTSCVKSRYTEIQPAEFVSIPSDSAAFSAPAPWLLFLHWTICLGQFVVQISLLLTCIQRGGGLVPHNSDFPPRSIHTPCPGMKLTLACRLGAEISPNRRDKNQVPWTPAARAVREQPWGHDVREVLLSPRCKLWKACRVWTQPVCPPACHTLVRHIKIHELRWFECQGLWQRSPSA